MSSVPGIRTRARDLTDAQLAEVINCAVAVLVGAAYVMYDEAIAMELERRMRRAPAAIESLLDTMECAFNKICPRQDMLSELRTKQSNLPRLDSHITQTWVMWAAEAHGNWLWLMDRCASLQESYWRRTRKVAPLFLELRRLSLGSPRPRGPGRTPFPLEPC